MIVWNLGQARVAILNLMLSNFTRKFCLFFMHHLNGTQLSLTQSICAHYSSLSGRPDIFLGSGTLKKRFKTWVAKTRVQKNRVIVIQKEKRPGCHFSFWITMTLVFAPWFLHPIFWTWSFLKFQTLKKYQADLIN